jgi:hypothetical protein
VAVCGHDYILAAAESRRDFACRDEAGIPIYSSTHPTAGFFINGTTSPRTFGVRAGIKF